MTRSFVGSLCAIGCYVLGARYGLAWGFLAGVCLLAGVAILEAADEAARRARRVNGQR